MNIPQSILYKRGSILHNIQGNPICIYSVLLFYNHTIYFSLNGVI